MKDRRSASHRKRNARHQSKCKSKTSFLSPPHPALLQSAAYGLSWAAASSSSPPSSINGSIPTTRGSESFTPTQLREGIGAAPGEAEDEEFLAPLTNIADGKDKRKRAYRSGNEHPFFAMMCRLLYAQRPKLLVPFLRLISFISSSALAQLTVSSSSPPPALTNLIRTWNFLPPFPYYLHVMPKENARSEAKRSVELFEKQLEARVWLLCHIGQAANGITSFSTFFAFVDRAKVLLHRH